MNQSERDITRAIRGILKVLGVFHWKVLQGSGSTPGVSDILGIYQGRMFAIMVKLAGDLSDHQQRFIDRINREGGIAFTARSIDDVIDGLGVRDRFLI
uniref:VRR-NUC domain-containing protein n=1 Tax=viral metagenome TaxID=1070528 RepID=A0A6H1ZZG2_9ZZZZ